MCLKLVGSAGEGICLTMAVRLGWAVSHLDLATLGEEGRFDRVGGLRGREETVDDAVCPDGESGISVVSGFRTSCFLAETFSCCNLQLSAWEVAKSACSCWSCLLLWRRVKTFQQNTNPLKAMESGQKFPSTYLAFKRVFYLYFTRLQ